MLPNELTVSEAQSLSAYTRCHLYNLINARKLKARRAKLRGSPPLILIERASLEAYMQTRGRETINGNGEVSS